MKYAVYACVLMLLNAVVSCIKIDDPQPCLPVQGTGGKYWVGTLGGFLGFNGDTHWEQDTSKTGVFAIAIDHRNTKWFVRSQDVYESIYKVSRYEEETGITDFSYRNSIMPRSYILGIAVDHDDAVWLPTGEGLIKITRVRE